MSLSAPESASGRRRMHHTGPSSLLGKELIPLMWNVEERDRGKRQISSDLPGIGAEKNPPRYRELRNNTLKVPVGRRLGNHRTKRGGGEGEGRQKQPHHLHSLSEVLAKTLVHCSHNDARLHSAPRDTRRPKQPLDDLPGLGTSLSLQIVRRNSTVASSHY